MLDLTEIIHIPSAKRLDHIQEYYFSIKLREIRKRRDAGEDIINLGIGNPDFPPPVAAQEKLIEVARRANVHGYQPYKGSQQLREAFSAYYQRVYKVDLNTETEILPLIGSKEGIMHISMAYLNEGDEVLVPDPGYPTYSSVSKLVGAKVVKYPLSAENDWAPDFEQIAQRDLSKVKLMWINYPHMPTGAKASMELFEKIIDFGRKHRILICHDNPYSRVLNPNPLSIHRVRGAKGIALELNSMSKSHNMAGWRLGMVSGAAPLIQEVLKVKSNMDSGMFLPLQEAAVAALGVEDQWHAERNAMYKKRRALAYQLLEKLNCSIDREQVGMFLWAKIPEEQESGEAYSEYILNQCLVFITPGFIFGEQGDRYIRLSLCSSEELLQTCLTRISSVM